MLPLAALVVLAHSTLNSLLKEQSLDDESFYTLMCEVEAIMNERPITKVSDDPNDMSALTPNHLLFLREYQNVPPGIITKDDTYRRKWKQIQYMATSSGVVGRKNTCQLFRNDRNGSTNKPIQIGDLVLIANQNMPRGHWPKGLVIETYPDKKGIVRQVKLRTADGFLLRDVRKICFLEGLYL